MGPAVNAADKVSRGGFCQVTSACPVPGARLDYNDGVGHGIFVALRDERLGRHTARGKLLHARQRPPGDLHVGLPRG